MIFRSRRWRSSPGLDAAFRRRAISSCPLAGSDDRPTTADDMRAIPVFPASRCWRRNDAWSAAPPHHHRKLVEAIVRQQRYRAAIAAQAVRTAFLLHRHNADGRRAAPGRLTGFSTLNAKPRRPACARTSMVSWTYGAHVSTGTSPLTSSTPLATAKSAASAGIAPTRHCRSAPSPWSLAASAIMSGATS